MRFRTRTSLGVRPLLPAAAALLSLSLNSPTSRVMKRRCTFSRVGSSAASRFSTLNPCTTAELAIELLDEPSTPTRAAAGTQSTMLAPRRVDEEEDSDGDPSALRFRKSGSVAWMMERGDKARVVNWWVYDSEKRMGDVKALNGRRSAGPESGGVISQGEIGGAVVVPAHQEIGTRSRMPLERETRSVR